MKKEYSMVMCLGANRTPQPVTSIGPQVRLNALDRPENAAVRRTLSVRQLREQSHCERPRPAARKCRAKSKRSVRELANRTERAWRSYKWRRLHQLQDGYSSRASQSIRRLRQLCRRPSRQSGQVRQTPRKKTKHCIVLGRALFDQHRKTNILPCGHTEEVPSSLDSRSEFHTHHSHHLFGIVSSRHHPGPCSTSKLIQLRPTIAQTGDLHWAQGRTSKRGSSLRRQRMRNP